MTEKFKEAVPQSGDTHEPEAAAEEAQSDKAGPLGVISRQSAETFMAIGQVKALAGSGVTMAPSREEIEGYIVGNFLYLPAMTFVMQSNHVSLDGGSVRHYGDGYEVLFKEIETVPGEIALATYRFCSQSSCAYEEPVADLRSKGVKVTANMDLTVNDLLLGHIFGSAEDQPDYSEVNRR